MAYVPGYSHDLFLSYAHNDLPWATALQERLSERLLHRLGCKCEIWQDEKKLRTGQDFAAELDKAIRASTAFIAVLSRNYQNSTWCEKELEAFLEESQKGQLETGGYGRVLKVVRLPWLNDAHEGFHRPYQHFDFFRIDPNTGLEREFSHTSERFRNAVDTLSSHIEKLFEALLRNMEKVFVARAAADASAERDSIVSEIRASGYALSPPPDGRIPKGLDGKALRPYIDATRVTVHILGASYDVAVREQIDIAREAGKKTVFCLVRGHRSAVGDQRTLIEDIRENRWGLREGTWALLESPSATDLGQDLIALLQPSRPAVPARNDDGARVYLMCDPTTSEDAGFAREVQGRIREREKRIQVELPQLPGETLSPGARHERLLRECDGLLLYHEKAPQGWYTRNFGDLLMADKDKARAMLLCGSGVAYPGVTVVQRRDPFDLAQLEPFLAPLRDKSEPKSENVAGR